MDCQRVGRGVRLGTGIGVGMDRHDVVGVICGVTLVTLLILTYLEVI